MVLNAESHFALFRTTRGAEKLLSHRAKVRTDGSTTDRSFRTRIPPPGASQPKTLGEPHLAKPQTHEFPVKKVTRMGLTPFA